MQSGAFQSLILAYYLKRPDGNRLNKLFLSLKQKSPTHSERTKSEENLRIPYSHKRTKNHVVWAPPSGGHLTWLLWKVIGRVGQSVSFFTSPFECQLRTSHKQTKHNIYNKHTHRHTLKRFFIN